MTTQTKEQQAVALADKRGIAGPSGYYLDDFSEDQWWFRELLAVVANGTDDQKRAVAVVRNLLATVDANIAMLADHEKQVRKAIAAMQAQNDELRARVAELERDAARYQRLRILGVAPMGSQVLARGLVIRFQTLDSFVDEDMKAHTSRGEAAMKKGGGV